LGKELAQFHPAEDVPCPAASLPSECVEIPFLMGLVPQGFAEGTKLLEAQTGHDILRQRSSLGLHKNCLPRGLMGLGGRLQSLFLAMATGATRSTETGSSRVC